MRTADERVAAVRRRSRRLRRRRSDRALVTLACLMALPLVELVLRYAVGGSKLPDISDSDLFGATSLFGTSAGGYVLVAVISFAVAALLTAFLMIRRYSASKEAGEASENGDEK